MYMLIVPLLSSNPFDPLRNVFSTSFFPHFLIVLHILWIIGGLKRASLLFLSHLSTYCQNIESKYQGNVSLFY